MKTPKTVNILLALAILIPYLSTWVYYQPKVVTDQEAVNQVLQHGQMVPVDNTLFTYLSWGWIGVITAVLFVLFGSQLKELIKKESND